MWGVMHLVPTSAGRARAIRGAAALHGFLRYAPSFGFLPRVNCGGLFTSLHFFELPHCFRAVSIGMMHLLIHPTLNISMGCPRNEASEGPWLATRDIPSYHRVGNTCYPDRRGTKFLPGSANPAPPTGELLWWVSAGRLHSTSAVGRWSRATEASRRYTMALMMWRACLLACRPHSFAADW